VLRFGLNSRFEVADSRVEQSPVDEGRPEGLPIMGMAGFGAAFRRSRRLGSPREGEKDVTTARGQRRRRRRTAAREEQSSEGPTP
jgi:hypothetical protein